MSRDFNLWWDPEAAHIVLRAPWKSITATPIDITIKTRMDKTLIERIAKGIFPSSKYVAKYATESPMWDELTFAAWLDPTIITKRQTYFLDAEIDHGASYGNTIVWSPAANPGLGEQPVSVNLDLNLKRFYDMFVNLMNQPPNESR
jgi:inosine-uridine nucleoside N-ribohydrolase